MGETFFWEMINSRIKILLFLLPLLIPFCIIFLSGIIIAVMQSIGIFVFSYTYPEYFFAYREILSQAWFYRSMALTLFVSLSTAVISVIAGIFISYRIWKLPDNLKKWGILVKIPLILPHITVGFIVILLFSRSGFFSSLSNFLGLTDSMESFPLILYSRLGVDIILAGIYKETPFAVIMIYAVLSRLDKKLIETAQMLGAGSRQIFICIILPHIMPAVSTVFIILFIYNLGSFEIPYVLGSSNPGVLSIKIFDYFFQKDLSMRPYAMAMLVIILIFSTLFIYIYSRLISRVDIRDRKI